MNRFLDKRLPDMSHGNWFSKTKAIVPKLGICLVGSMKAEHAIYNCLGKCLINTKILAYFEIASVIDISFFPNVSSINRS